MHILEMGNTDNAAYANVYNLQNLSYHINIENDGTCNKPSQQIII
jgi:hypothetical protein